MKKMLKTAFVYAIAAMCAGVFYREFTKFSGFTGQTALSVVHTHLFMLGMVLFLLAALFCGRWELAGQKRFRAFSILCNVGVPLTAVMLLIRGILQVNGTAVSPGLDAAVSGLAGIGHILTGIGIIFFFLALLQAVSKNQAASGDKNPTR